MDKADLNSWGEGFVVILPVAAMAINVAVKVVESGIDVDKRARIEACRSAGKTGRLYFLLEK